MQWYRTIDQVACDGSSGPDRGSGIYSRLPDGRVVEIHRDGDRVRCNVVHANATGNGYDDASTKIRATFASFSEAKRVMQARFWPTGNL